MLSFVSVLGSIKITNRCDTMASVNHLYTVLFLVILFTSCLNKCSEEKGKPIKIRRLFQWIYPLTYIENVTSQFHRKLREHGIGDLSVRDKVYDVNVTRYKIHLLGSLDYTDGFLVDIQNISRHPRDNIWYIDKERNMAVVKFMISMTNVTVYYDVKVDLDVLESPATAVLTFPTNNIQVLVYHHWATQETGILSMRTNSVSGPKTTFLPDSPVMQAIAYNARLTMSSSLFSDLSIWINSTLCSMLEEIVKETDFPLKVKWFRKQPLRLPSANTTA